MPEWMQDGADDANDDNHDNDDIDDDKHNRPVDLSHQDACKEDTNVHMRFETPAKSNKNKKMTSETLPSPPALKQELLTKLFAGR